MNKGTNFANLQLSIALKSFKISDFFTTVNIDSCLRTESRNRNQRKVNTFPNQKLLPFKFVYHVILKTFFMENTNFDRETLGSVTWEIIMLSRIQNFHTCKV